MALSLVQNHFGSRSNATYFYAIREVVSMRKLKKYKPTRFMAKTSHYDKDAADYPDGTGAGSDDHGMAV